MKLRGIPGIAGFAPPEPRGLASDYARDRIAAVADREAMALAIDRRHKIAFFAIDGALAPGPPTRDAIGTLAVWLRGGGAGAGRVGRRHGRVGPWFSTPPAWRSRRSREFSTESSRRC